MTAFIQYIRFMMWEELVYFAPVIYAVVVSLISGLFFQRYYKTGWGKTLCLLFLFSVNIAFALLVMSPEAKYKSLQVTKADMAWTLAHCRIDVMYAQKATLFSKARDAWRCPDGVTRYLSVEYRGKGDGSDADDKTERRGGE